MQPFEVDWTEESRGNCHEFVRENRVQAGQSERPEKHVVTGEAIMG